jgi:hypothetical protein
VHGLLINFSTKSLLTNTEDQRSTVSSIYSAVCAVLGDKKCLQIGSYPRYTAINPPHDLDVLYVLGTWDGKEPRAEGALRKLKARFEKEFKNPTSFAYVIRLQTHSISVSFLDGDREVFAVDVVPALKYGTISLARISTLFQRFCGSDIKRGWKDVSKRGTQQN